MKFVSLENKRAFRRGPSACHEDNMYIILGVNCGDTHYNVNISLLP